MPGIGVPGAKNSMAGTAGANRASTALDVEVPPRGRSTSIVASTMSRTSGGILAAVTTPTIS
jgi:hypothetical protein